MRSFNCLAFFLMVSFHSFGDYLKTYRSANIKEQANSSSETLLAVKADQVLQLLDEGNQTNGYYQVVLPDGSQKSGWIYRTLVRRYSGEAPGSTPITPTLASSGSQGDVEVTVIDVGAGLSCLAKLPGKRYFIFDGGRSKSIEFIHKEVPLGSAIELLILSHTDADHWGGVKAIVEDYKVKKIIRTEYRVNDYSPVYNEGIQAIRNATGIDDINLSKKGNMVPGTVLYEQDDVKIYGLCGFKEPESSWGKLNVAKANNAVSIMAKLEFNGHSILFGGDALGRDDCADPCIATEKFVLDNANANLIDSDVIIAPHHGADNASCETFIEKVSPEYVVFSAGHAFRHPRESTAERYIDFGVDINKIFRTDRGDSESSTGDPCKLEWSYGGGNESDKVGDDNVRIVLPKQGSIRIGYINN